MEKVKVGDTVQVMAGAERSLPNKTNKRGKVLSIDREALRLKVEGLRIIKRHVKKGRDRANPDGGILERPGTIALSAVAVVCQKCDAPVRVGIRVEGDKRKRFCKKCGTLID
jgi:large subunit ribosomal protein L24